jgi:hypothetical protein
MTNREGEMREDEAKIAAKGMIGDYLRMKGISVESGKNFRCLNPDHEDKNPSMGFDRGKNRVHCFSCSATYDVFELVGMDYGVSGSEMFRKTYDILGLKIGQEATHVRKSAIPEGGDAKTIVVAERDFTAYFSSCAKRLRDTQYVASRGLSAATAERFHLGFDPCFGKDGWKALIIPTSLNSYAARNIDPECGEGNRYRKIGSSSLFNVEAMHASDGRPVFVVEGEIDALSVIEAGGSAIALGSAANVPSLLRRLKEAPPSIPLIIALDNDDAGRAAAAKIDSGMAALGLSAARINLYGAFKDANEALKVDSGAFGRAIARAETTAFRMFEKPWTAETSNDRFSIIDIRSAFESKPPDLDFVWPGFLSGTVGALIAPGATGKSFWALEACMAVACNIADGDLLGLKPSCAGRTAYLAGEDSEPAIAQRVHAIGKYLPPPAREEIIKNLSANSFMGVSVDVMDTTQQNWIIAKHEGFRLIVFDTLSRLHLLDENSNGDMARLICSLERIAVKTGASVLYLHHASKISVRDGQMDRQHAARGASALVDNARWCGFMAGMTEDEAGRLSVDGSTIIGNNRNLFVRFGTCKQNYGIALRDQWCKRSEGGVLVPVEITKAQKGDSHESKKERHRSERPEA